MQETPIFESRRSWRSFGNTYRIYTDRVELECRILFHTFRLHMKEIVGHGLFKPPAIADGIRHHRLRGIKLDFGDLCRGVYISRRSGLVRHFYICPDDPNAFNETLHSLLPDLPAQE